MAEVTALRNNALPYPVYGVPFGFKFPIFKTDGTLISAAAGLDSERSLNGDTFADCTNEATEIATNSGSYYLLCTGAEMTCDAGEIQVKSSTTGAIPQIITYAPVKLPSLRSGTVAANAADGTTLQLDSSAVAVDDYYNGCLLVGTLDSSVEARVISDYAGSTKVCTVSPAFVTTPDNNDTFVVYQPLGRQFADSNTMSFGGVAGTFAAGLPSVNATQFSGQTITAAAGVTLPASVASPTNITAGTITTVTNLTNAPTAGDLTATMKTSVTAAVPTAVQNADALLDRDMSTGADSGSTTVRTARQALRFLRNKWSISGTTLTVCKENDSDASWTSTVTATNGADPITANDPAGP